MKAYYAGYILFIMRLQWKKKGEAFTSFKMMIIIDIHLFKVVYVIDSRNFYLKTKKKLIFRSTSNFFGKERRKDQDKLICMHLNVKRGKFC